MDPIKLEDVFKAWWAESYGRPPGTHAVMTHAAFAEYVLRLMELLEVADD